MSSDNYHKKGYHNTEYKKETIKAAKELLYGSEIINKLENAKDDLELSRIMADARGRMK